MKTRVKYMPQYPLSAASSTNTTNSFDTEFVGQKRAQKAAYIRLCTYIGVTLSVVALVTCSILFMLLLSSNNPMTQQSQEVQDLKDQLEFQNQRLHRMQKELQFMLSRQKTQEAKEDSVRRLERLFSPENRRDWSQLSALASVNSPAVAPSGVQTISQQAFAGLNPAEDGDEGQSEEDDDEEEETLVLQPDVVIDVNELPLAPPNKRRGGSKVWPSLPLASLSDGSQQEALPPLPELKPVEQSPQLAQNQANAETSETEDSEEDAEIESEMENKANKVELEEETESNVEEEEKDVQAEKTVTQTAGSNSRTEEEEEAEDDSDEDD